MTVQFEVWNPARSERTIGLDEVREAYRSLPDGISAIFTWNDCEEECLIVAVEPEFSVVTMGCDASFWNLKISDDTEEVEISMGADDFTWARGCLLPRDMGVEVLLKAEDFASLFWEYSWADG
ncbi:hypothetical protein [Streptomyces mutomycini]|uniref:Uncharacterized protein n=1 Tax=Streptomyces mutomycini TaxID=284036 RepID=A0ABW0B5T9_9ACTN|nr:hypothetical protein [Streptomyces mutomycini]